MANALVKKKKPGPAPKITAAEARARLEKLEPENEKLRNGAYCYMCDTHKTRDKFYVSSDPMIKSGITPICKRCALLIAERFEDGEFKGCTKESVQKALMYLNKPFLESLWNASIQESENEASGKMRSTPWRAYVKNAQFPQYATLTYKDSDMFKPRSEIKHFEEKTEEELMDEHSGQDTYDSFLKNKQDVLRLLDYDPFDKEAVEDQPFLYSQLLGMLDASEDANEDMMRVSSAIQIVRAFLQSAKIDDTIAKLMGDVQSITHNSATIKSLQDSKQKLTTMITNLAAENCLSLKNSKKQTRGTDTWSGKIKAIRDLSLRDAQMNGFDESTCRGMAQVQEISDASIMKQLALDDSEWSDIVADMRVVNQRLRKEKNSYKEINRILLQENLDLKDLISDKGYQLNHDLRNLKELYSVFSDEETGIEFVPDEEEGGEMTYESDNPSV